MNIKKANAIIQQISETISNWPEFAEITGVEKALNEKIGKSHLVL